MAMHMTGIGIVSFDHMHARSYARCFNHMPDCRLVGVADPDEVRGRQMASTYRTEFMSLDALLDNDGVDGVCICSANSRHKQDVVAAAEAGKHVMVEKPIATTIQDAKEMITACEKEGLILQVAFVMRYSPIVLETKKAIDSGCVGEIVAMSGTNHGSMPGGWFTRAELSGGGAIIDHTVHVADLMNWFVGGGARRVYALGGNRLHENLGIDDAGLVLVAYEQAIGSIDPSWSRPEGYPIWGDVRMRIFGSESTVELDGFCQNLGLTKRGDRLRLLNYATDIDYHACLDFIHCIRKGSKPRATGQDGLAALEIALAAYGSVQSGRVVQLPMG